MQGIKAGKRIRTELDMSKKIKTVLILMGFYIVFMIVLRFWGEHFLKYMSNNSVLLLAIFMFCFLLWGVCLGVRDTIRKSGCFGANFDYKNLHCPCCNQKMPYPINLPESLSQAFSGTRTCPNCKSEVDKWGKKVQNEAKLVP